MRPPWPPWPKDTRSLIPKDIYGTPLDDLTVMEGVNSANDVYLLIDMEISTTLEILLRQFWAPYHTRILLGCPGMMKSMYYPYLDAEQVHGMIAGVGAAAEYELLLRRPGDALKSTDVMSVSHLMVIAFIVVGNIGYFVERSRGKRR